jgi:mRNA interferase RelE/StbE
VTGGQPAAYIRLTDPSVADLHQLATHNPQALKWALKKMLLLEENPHAGEPLLGGLIGWRKLTVGDRDWRVVWRPMIDPDSMPVIEVAEVWAVGARSDREVYEEMAARVTAMPDSPRTVALAEVIERFGKLRAGITPASQPVKEELPSWLIDQLVHAAGLRREAVENMTLKEAVDAWTEWTSKPH